MKFTIFQHSRQGPRPYNLDRLAYSYSKDSLLLMIADGMGGHRHGEVAAQLAVATLTDAFQRMALPALANPAKFLMSQLHLIHDLIAKVSEEQEMLEAPRTTIVAAVVQHGMLYCAHAGDSRLYHFRDGHLLYRTEDHSIVQSMYNKGIISKDEMLHHPYRHKIFSCLGGDVAPKIAITERQELAEGDTVLLCTDGLWGAVSDEEIKYAMLGASISENVTALLDTAEAADADQGDNMSAIGLQWGGRLDSQLAVSTLQLPPGFSTTIMNPLTHTNLDFNDPSLADDLSDDDIERTIAEIQIALQKTKRNK